MDKAKMVVKLRPIIVNNMLEPRWNMVNNVITAQRWSNPELDQAWEKGGYDEMAKIVPKLFGMKAMYRENNSYIVFEFTDQQWTMFALRWAS